MNIIGHTHNQEHLRRQFQKASFPQSLLFTGPESVGKFLVAFELAKELVGAQDFQPGEGMPVPQDIFIVAPEVQETKNAVKERGIKIDAIREARAFLGQYPSHGRYRVVLIQDAHLLSEEAQNALLKTLEEPNSSSVLILVTHEPGQLLETVRSRLIHELFQLVSLKEMQEAFSDQDLEQAGIPVFFRNFGRPGILSSALQEPKIFEEEKSLLTKLYTLSLLSVGEKLALAEKLSKNIPQAKKLLTWWLPGLHERASQETEPKRVTRYFQVMAEIDRTLILLKTTNANSRLLLEQLFLRV